jgi:hypothetical protein
MYVANDVINRIVTSWQQRKIRRRVQDGARKRHGEVLIRCFLPNCASQDMSQSLDAIEKWLGMSEDVADLHVVSVFGKTISRTRATPLVLQCKIYN